MAKSLFCERAGKRVLERWLSDMGWEDMRSWRASRSPSLHCGRELFADNILDARHVEERCVEVRRVEGFGVDEDTAVVAVGPGEVVDQGVRAIRLFAGLVGR